MRGTGGDKRDDRSATGAPRLLCCGFDSCLRKLGGRWGGIWLGLCKLGPDVAPVIGAQVAASDDAVRGALDGDAVGGARHGATGAPVAYGGLPNPQRCRQTADATDDMNGEVQVVNFSHEGDITVITNVCQ